jgi:hypothetical protein
MITNTRAETKKICEISLLCDFTQGELSIPSRVYNADLCVIATAKGFQGVSTRVGTNLSASIRTEKVYKVNLLSRCAY